jgi:hypothetical protein
MTLPRTNRTRPSAIRLAFFAALAWSGLASAAWRHTPDVSADSDQDWWTQGNGPSEPRIDFDRSGSVYVSAGKVLYHGVSEEGPWHRISPPDSEPVTRPRPLAVGEGFIFLGERRSLDRGRTWQRDPGSLDVAGGIPYAYGVFGAGRVLRAGMYDNLALSVDSGSTWKRVRSGQTYGYFTRIACLSGGWALAAPLYYSPLVSYDSGETWKALRAGDLKSAILLATGPGSAPNEAWALDAGIGRPPMVGLLRRAADSFSVSTRLVTEGFPGSRSTSFAASLPDHDGRVRLWLGTRGEGVFMSADSGSTWTARNEGLGDLRVEAVAVTPAGRVLILARDGLYVEPAATTSLRPARGPKSRPTSGPTLLFGKDAPGMGPGEGRRIDGKRAALLNAGMR